MAAATTSDWETQEEDARRRQEEEVVEEGEVVVVGRHFDRQNLWGYISFAWVNPLLAAGRQSPDNITTELVASLKSTADDAQKLVAALERAVDSNDRSLVRGMLTCFRQDMMCQQVWTALESVQRVSMAVLLRELLNAVERGAHERAFVFASLLSLTAFAYCLCHHQTFWFGMRLGHRMRVSGVGLIHRKALRLAPHGFQFGGLTALVANDMQRAEELGMYYQFLWWAPIEACAVLALLALEMGVLPAVVGVGVLLLLAPAQTALSRNIGLYRQRTARLTDLRVKETSEICSGVLPVKMHQFEECFRERIQSKRSKEEESLRAVTTFRAGNAAVFFAAPLLASFALFTLYTYFGKNDGVLTQARVFYAIALLQLPKLWLANFFLRAGEICSEARASVARINAFLALPEWKVPRPPPADVPDVAARLNGCDFAWTSAGDLQTTSSGGSKNNSTSFKTLGPLRCCLRNIKLDIRQGELLAVVGRVGSGKTSLLSALLGELAPVQGSALETMPQAPPVAAVCHQEPWLKSGTVRENVIFGSACTEFDADQYELAVSSSALERDLACIPGGDNCMLGERGVNLSGGQKARLTLARCVYCPAKLKLLDDPLSALDAVVAKRVFEDCICGAMRECTRVLVTHQRQFLRQCDRIAVLVDGELVALGTYDEVFRQLTAIDEAKMDAGNTTNNGLGVNLADIVGDDGTRSGRTSIDVDSIAASMVTSSSEHQQIGTVAADDLIHDEKKRDKLNGTSAMRERDGGLVKEEAASGHTKRAIYVSMISRFGISSFIAVLLALAVGQFVQTGMEVYLSKYARLPAKNQIKHHDSMVMYLALFVASSTAIAVWRSYFYMQRLVSTNTNLHSDMLASVLRAPLYWFHVNPVGRVLNRFTKDLATADEIFPFVSFDCVQCMGFCLCAFILISVAMPLSMPFTFALVRIFLNLRSTFLSSSREVKRGEAVSRSPVYADFAAALKGLSTIRCFGVDDRVHQEFLDTLDCNASWHLAFVGVQRWLGFRLDAICGAVVLLASFISVYLICTCWNRSNCGFLCLRTLRRYGFITSVLKPTLRIVKTK